MSLFSRQPDVAKSAGQPIPRDILNAVSVMGSKNFLKKETSPVRSDSPLLETSPFASASDSTAPKQVTPTKKEVVSSATAQVPSKKNEVPQNRQEKPGVTKEKSQEKAPIQKEGITEKALLTDKVPKKFPIKSVIIVSGVIVLLAAVLLGWYFLLFVPQRASQAPAPSDASPVDFPVTVDVSVGEPPYAPNTANYLLIDVETVTERDFATLIKQIGEKIVAADMRQPVEFLLTDKNNNPIAFSRFAFLMNVDLSEPLIASLGESFSLYVYNDANMARIGLVLSMSGDQLKTEKLITSKEKSLPYQFRNVLFSGQTIARETTFRSGVYENQTVRFVNIDLTQNISFDYMLRGNEWLIGSSKETLRAVVDKRY